MFEKNVIEVAPLAFMRGRTLNDAFIIMDEAQNTTIEQMKMFLTRMATTPRRSSPATSRKSICPTRANPACSTPSTFSTASRHPLLPLRGLRRGAHALVQRIVRAYESVKSQQQELPLALGEAIEVGSPAAKTARNSSYRIRKAAINREEVWDS